VIQTLSVSAATRHPASFIAFDFPRYPRRIVLN
jgi:hypothetical protein